MASLTVIQGSGIFSQQQDGIVGTPSPTHHSDQLSLPSILTMDKMNSDFSKSSVASNLLDTTYQRAILSARARLLEGEPPRYPEEWRLPYAPLPARPDLTRTVFFGDQRIRHRKEHRRRGRDRSQTHPMSETVSVHSFLSFVFFYQLKSKRLHYYYYYSFSINFFDRVSNDDVFNLSMILTYVLVLLVFHHISWWLTCNICCSNKIALLVAIATYLSTYFMEIMWSGGCISIMFVRRARKGRWSAEGVGWEGGGDT